MRTNIIRSVILEAKRFSANEAYNIEFTVEKYAEGLAKAFKHDKSEEVKKAEWRALKTPEEIARALLAKFEEIDPTQDKKYVSYIVRQYIARNPQSELEDLESTIKPALRLYQQAKDRKKLPPAAEAKDDPRNIDNFKTLVDFLDFTEQFEPPKEAVVNRGRYTEILNNSVVRLIIPLDVNASCYYGQGTRWCTAATQSGNLFDSYSSRGPLVIFLPKRPRYAGEKYQFHMDKAGNGGITLMNEKDNQVSTSMIIDLMMRRFGDLRGVFEQHTPFKRNEFIQFMDKDIVDNYIYTSFKNLRPIQIEEKLSDMIIANRLAGQKVKVFEGAINVEIEKRLAASIQRVKQGGSDALFSDDSSRLQRVDDVEKQIKRMIADAVVAPLIGSPEVLALVVSRIGDLYAQLGKAGNTALASVMAESYYKTLGGVLRNLLVSEL